MNKNKPLKIGIFYFVDGIIFSYSQPYNRSKPSIFNKVVSLDKLSHEDFWTICQDFLQKEDTPSDFYPRGRVEFDVRRNVFKLYLDSCLNEGNVIVRQIKEKFNLRASGGIRVDFNYNCAMCDQGGFKGISKSLPSNLLEVSTGTDIVVFDPSKQSSDITFYDPFACTQKYLSDITEEYMIRLRAARYELRIRYPEGFINKVNVFDPFTAAYVELDKMSAVEFCNFIDWYESKEKET